MVGELEAMYFEMLDDHSIAWSTRVSQFAEVLLSRITQRVVRQQVEYIFLILLFKITFKMPMIILNHW